MKQNLKINFILITLVFLLFSCKVGYSDSNTLNSNSLKPVADVSKNTTVSDLQNDLRSISKNQSPSVVFIGTEKKVSQQDVDPFEYFFGNPFGNQNPKNKKSPNQQQFTQTALGSGVIFKKSGNSYFIVTNNHVIDGADKITVKVEQKKSYPAKLVGTDPDVDIAIIKIDTGDDLKIAKFGDSNGLQVGDFVIAIGNPFGLSGTMTFGIVSALGRNDISSPDKPSLTNFIQTDAAINPGNSGGALLNIDGEVIGINTMIYSQSGGSIGIGFAIPINIVKKISEDVVDNGKTKIDHGYLGVMFQPITEENSKTLGLKDGSNGMLVVQVQEGSPAEKSDIKAGDIILEANGKVLNQSSDLSMAVGNSAPGAKISFKILRDGQIINKEVSLGNRTELNAITNNNSTNLNDYGFDVSELNANLKTKYKIPANITGVVITAVDQGGKAGQAGIKEGDVIFKVNNKKVNKIDDLNKVLTDNKNGKNYLFIYRQGKEFIVNL